MEEIGGGASRSTDPAAGSSAATDVSLREHVETRIGSLDRIVHGEIQALRRETQAAYENAERAVSVAKDEAKERLESHNGLIEQMRHQAETFASAKALEDFKTERHLALDTFKEASDGRFGRVENFQAKIIGGLLILSFIGVANAVKLWTGPVHTQTPTVTVTVPSP